ncbi:MAG: hypothetical protein MN733_00385 [Nitrososphaera sp.]|nr:hypothetical protein [Nitrososphaera sp.]
MNTEKMSGIVHRIVNLKENIDTVYRNTRGGIDYRIIQLFEDTRQILNELASQTELLSQSASEIPELRARMAQMTGELAVLRATVTLNEETK